MDESLRFAAHLAQGELDGRARKARDNKSLAYDIGELNAVWDAFIVRFSNSKINDPMYDAIRGCFLRSYIELTILMMNKDAAFYAFESIVSELDLPEELKTTLRKVMENGLR